MNDNNHMEDLLRTPKIRRARVPRWMVRAADWMLKIRGWKRVGEVPCPCRFVAICAPHTSNWDVYYWLALAWGLGVRPHYMVKHTLFWWPLGVFLRWTGAVPVDRTSHRNAVQQMADIFDQNEEFVLGVAAEGTRKRAAGWKSGFYYIALNARVPIAMGYLDYKKKIVGISEPFVPSGNLEEDFKIVQAFYRDKTAKYENQRGPIELEKKPPQQPKQASGGGG